jgi:hypothetical protein
MVCAAALVLTRPRARSTVQAKTIYMPTTFATLFPQMVAVWTYVYKSQAKYMRDLYTAMPKHHLSFWGIQASDVDPSGLNQVNPSSNYSNVIDYLYLPAADIIKQYGKRAQPPPPSGKAPGVSARTVKASSDAMHLLFVDFANYMNGFSFFDAMGAVTNVQPANDGIMGTDKVAVYRSFKAVQYEPNSGRNWLWMSLSRASDAAARFQELRVKALNSSLAALEAVMNQADGGKVAEDFMLSVSIKGKFGVSLKMSIKPPGESLGGALGGKLAKEVTNKFQISGSLKAEVGFEFAVDSRVWKMPVVNSLGQVVRLPSGGPKYKYLVSHRPLRQASIAAELKAKGKTFENYWVQRLTVQADAMGKAAGIEIKLGVKFVQRPNRITHPNWLDLADKGSTKFTVSFGFGAAGGGAAYFNSIAGELFAFIRFVSDLMTARRVASASEDGTRVQKSATKSFLKVIKEACKSAAWSAFVAAIVNAVAAEVAGQSLSFLGAKQSILSQQSTITFQYWTKGFKNAPWRFSILSTRVRRPPIRLVGPRLSLTLLQSYCTRPVRPPPIIVVGCVCGGGNGRRRH